MRRVTFLLRIWVILGAALLFLQTPKGRRGYAQYSPGSCINFAVGPQTCPSGCTTSSFTQYTVASSGGVYFLSVWSKTPCGSAKQGETCNNPTQYFQVYDFDDCCAHLGVDCTGVGHDYMNCCDPSPVVCMAWCCIDNGGSCSPSRPGDCCTELCLSYNNKCGTCSTLGQPCGNNPDDCCYFYGVTCPYGFCCIGKGQPCARNSDCCNGYCLPCGMCAMM
jgi:hypothetical protein